MTPCEFQVLIMQELAKDQQPTVGLLKLKTDSGGYRHYVEAAKGKHIDIRCGESIEVQLGKYVERGQEDVLVPEQWLPGRYEAYLGPNTEAYLYLRLYPSGQAVKLHLPLGTLVRVK